MVFILVAVCTYRYVITLGLCSKYDVVTIPDLQHESLQILGKYDVRLLCYMLRLYFVCNHLILSEPQIYLCGLTCTIYSFQTTLCYYDVKDALALEPENPEALEMIERLKIKAKEMKQQAIQLNLVHRHRDALQKISMAIETDPSQPDYHITR